MRVLKFAVLLTVALTSVRASDCDYKFTLTTANPTVVINNKGLACYSWQVTDFVSGFSAVSFQFESASDFGGVPGPFAAFQGTVNTGINPNASITQNTTLYTGTFPWIRINLVSSTGSGNITGRVLGAQATSATLIPQAFQIQPLGTFITPNPGDFSFINQGNAVQTNVVDGIILSIADGGETDNLPLLCASIPGGGTSPWTVTAAFIDLQTLNINSMFTGLALYNPGGSLGTTELARSTASSNSSVFDSLFWACTTANFASCGSTRNEILPRFAPITWERVRDDGSANRVWEASGDGRTWQQQRDFVFIAGNWGQTGPIQKACFMVYSNGGAQQGGMSAKLVSWRICPNNTGAAC